LINILTLKGFMKKQKKEEKKGKKEKREWIK
jgi:hypothetical protein